MKKLIGILRLAGIASLILYMIARFIQSDSTIQNIFMYAALTAFSAVLLFWLYKLTLWLYKVYIKEYINS